MTPDFTVEESLLRIENRVKRGGHNINTDTVAKYKNGEVQTIGSSPGCLLELTEKMK